MNRLPQEITNFFLAMQAGPHGLAHLAKLFAPDAIYREPFSGQNTPHVGREAIIAAFSASRSDAFNDALIQIGDISIDGETITLRWTCISKAIPGGRGSGTNVFTLQNGLIQELHTTLDQEPNA